jgi:hypothetical protein
MMMTYTSPLRGGPTTVLPRCVKHPGLAPFFPHPEEGRRPVSKDRGNGAPKSADLWCPRSLRDRGGRLSARQQALK